MSGTESTRAIALAKKRAYYAKNREKILAAMKLSRTARRDEVNRQQRERYYKDHDRVLIERKAYRDAHPKLNRAHARVQRERNPEGDKARKKKWAANHADKRREMSVRWRRANKEKVAAHNAVAIAVRKRVLKKPDVCEGCGAGAVRLVAHHDDYTQKLKVRWLCGKCHNRHHFLIVE